MTIGIIRKKLLLSLLFFCVLYGAAYETLAQQVKMTTSLGSFVIELDAAKAPITSANFLKYVEGGHYKGGSFFRTVKESNQPNSPVKIEVIQAGAHPWQQNFLFDPIPLERTNKTGIKHKNSTVSMARAEPDSAQDSFFICIGDQPSLDFGGKRNPDGQGFAAFGHVISGMDVIKSIHEAANEGQALVPPILILSIELLN